MRRIQPAIAITLSLMTILLVVACSDQAIPEQTIPGETPTTSVDQPDAPEPPSTEVPDTTQVPDTTEAPTNEASSDTTIATSAEDEGVDPMVVAAIIAAVVLVGVGAWFIGRSSGDGESDTTINTSQ